MAFKMKHSNSTFPFKGESHDFLHEGGYKIVRKKLEDGVLGEAENGKTINVDTSVKPGSKKDKEVIAHEKHHQDEMQENLISYNDDEVVDKIAGKEYKREDGNLIDKETGKVYEEGDKTLPHEKRAYKAGNKAKNA